MTAAATAALALEGLPAVPCTLDVPWPRATEVHEPTGTRSVRRCVLPAGHEEREVPCRYEWFEQQTRPLALLDDEEF